MLGHKTMIAENPVSALSLFNTTDFDIVISEYFSDDKNYLKLFKKILSNKRQIKIIILTAMNYDLEDLQPLHNLGIENIFQKPIDPKIICKMIENFSHQHKLSVPLK